MRQVLSLIAGGGLLATLAASGAAAEAPLDPAPPLPEECEVESLDGERSPPSDSTTTDRSLSDVLDPCDGILAPPPVGDRDMTLPPPQTGATPVPPQALPDQPPAGDH